MDSLTAVKDKRFDTGTNTRQPLIEYTVIDKDGDDFIITAYSYRITSEGVLIFDSPYQEAWAHGCWQTVYIPEK